MEYARIYKLDSTNGLVYYGSTTQKYLSMRLGKHKSEAKRNSLKKCSSHLLFTEWATVTITLVENVENCKDKYELQARERFYIENNDCVNRQIPNRTQKEYREENKEYLKEWFKENYKANKEQYKENRREYYQANKEQIRETNKEWHKKNKEQHNKKNREYYEANKDKVNARAIEKIKCECGCEIARTNVTRHRKSEKHKNKMLVINKDVVATHDAGSVSPPSHICGEV